MKKKIIAPITILCLLTILYNDLRLPDYHITNSMSFSSADTRDTELTVIVYKCWGIDRVIKDIENEHNKINGTLGRLFYKRKIRILLYSSSSKIKV